MTLLRWLLAVFVVALVVAVTVRPWTEGDDWPRPCQITDNC